MKDINLTRGHVALVDDEDFERVSKHKWTANPQSHTVYGRRNFQGHTQMLHRFILEAKPRQIVDHINGDGLDNRRCNLRFITWSGNSANCRRRKLKGFSKVKGSWKARIVKDRKTYHLGTYPTPEAAAKAYDLKAKELFGSYAHLNFPEKVAA